MITPTNLVEILANLRCFKYYISHNDMWMCFESMSEEGEGVKKSLGRFETEEEADEFLEDYRKKLKEHIASLIVVVYGDAEKRLPAPLVKEVRKGKAPKRKLKKDASSERGHRDIGPETGDSRSDGVRGDPVRHEPSGESGEL